jgi:subtilisin family serine protease
VAWNTKIMPIRVLDMAGSGRDSWIVAGFEYAGRMGADIVNASLGGPGSGLIFDAVFQKYPNTLFVLAAGNDGSNNDQVPASPCNSPLPNVICVAATDSRDTLANFSNFGANNVDIAAPGVSIMSTMPSFDVLNSEDFEAETLSWVEEESSGVWQKVTGQNGNHFLDNSPNGPYNDNLKSTFKVGSPVELTNGCQFQYIAKIKVQAGPDWIQLQASKDGTNWQPAGPRLTGDAGFVNVAQDLSAFGSGPTWLRFRMETDAAGNDEGVVMDDLKTQCVSRTFGGDEYVRLNGTSMASPHVAGAAALLLAANPQANVQALKDALLQTVDPVPSLSGKVGTGGRLNVFNALKRITGQG